MLNQINVMTKYIYPEKKSDLHGSGGATPTARAIGPLIIINYRFVISISIITSYTYHHKTICVLLCITIID